jgi:rod shape-determining protein MreC
MGVITSKGILGIIENTSNHFATVQSILNEKSNINAKIKNTDHFGSLVWDMKRFDVVQLVDIPRLVPLTVGDTIVTGGMSSIFPENVPIGTIRKFDLNTSQSFYRIDVALFNDMTNIKNVYIVNNEYRDEIRALEKQTESDGQ